MKTTFRGGVSALLPAGRHTSTATRVPSRMVSRREVYSQRAMGPSPKSALAAGGRLSGRQWASRPHDGAEPEAEVP
jgi:hypothetical protein